MADFLPPPGPPPPRVPEGWKAQWNEQYKEWFYVNIYTKQSQWDKPTQPAFPADHDNAPPGGPPGYTGSDRFGDVSDKKSNPYDDHRGPGNTSSNDIDEDARLAAKLQAEEDARAQNTRGNAFQDYANTPLPQSSSSAQLPPREEKRGLFSKLLGKTNQQPQHGQAGYVGGYQQGGYPPQQGGYPPQQGYPPQGGYGGYPPQGGYGGYPPQGGGYGGYPPPGGYGGYPPQGYAQQPPKKSGGLGAAGGAALGLGGGLIGGMLLEDAIQGHDQNEYQQGYNAGEDNNNGQGGDYGGGGGDYGGGDDGGGGDGGGDGGGGD